MELWTIDTLSKSIANSNSLNEQELNSLLTFMNHNFPPAVYETNRQLRRSAIKNMDKSRDTLKSATQQFPTTVNWNTIDTSAGSLKGYGLVFTAGGEGERLRLSLLKQGVPADLLENFTKATFPLPDFYGSFGALQTNLAMVSSFCKNSGIDIPVIVTTGPAGTITDRVIPEILKENDNFGLKHVLVISQDERLHLTIDEKIAVQKIDGQIRPVTQPDETGGPLMKLKQVLSTSNISALDWLESRGCTKMIVVQATALYDTNLLPIMAAALGNHDCLGVGILRNDFAEKDPFGTFVSISKAAKTTTIILEQDIRNETTRTIKDQTGKYYLPFNTGFYAFRTNLLKDSGLPDFATPPKEINPDLPRSPKCGYAATDLLPLAKNPVILTIKPDMFGVLKTAEDLQTLSKIGKRFGLDELCKKAVPSK